MLPGVSGGRYALAVQIPNSVVYPHPDLSRLATGRLDPGYYGDMRLFRYRITRDRPLSRRLFTKRSATFKVPEGILLLTLGSQPKGKPCPQNF